MLRQLLPAAITPLGDDEVELVLSTGYLARDGHVLVPQGCELASYKTNPVWLWSHDPLTPVGRCEEIAVDGDKIRARVRFAPAGISAKADEIRGLVKSGVINAASVGFEPLDGEPLDPKKPKGGQRYTRWELLEGSFVAVPADPSALVTQRAAEGAAAEADGARGYRPRQRRQHAAAMLPRIRGMYGVGQLAYLLDMLCDAQRMAEFERSLEEDDSAVPEMLTACLRDLGEALVAMTAEEVAELIGDDEPGERSLSGETDPLVMAAKSPAVKRLRLGYVAARAAVTAQRAGKALSAANAAQLGQVEAHHARAMAHHRDAADCHGAIGDCHDGIGTAHERCRSAIDDLASDGADGGEHMPCRCDRCMRAHRALTRNLDAIADHNTGLGDEHEALGDAHRGIARSIRSASRCLRAVDGFEPGDENDSHQIQTSAGTGDSEGSEDGRALTFAARQQRLQALSRAA